MTSALFVAIVHYCAFAASSQSENCVPPKKITHLSFPNIASNPSFSSFETLPTGSVVPFRRSLLSQTAPSQVPSRQAYTLLRFSIYIQPKILYFLELYNYQNLTLTASIRVFSLLEAPSVILFFGTPLTLCDACLRLLLLGFSIALNCSIFTAFC